jgi:hypothetical protein
MQELSVLSNLEFVKAEYLDSKGDMAVLACPRWRGDSIV